MIICKRTAGNHTEGVEREALGLIKTKGVDEGFWTQIA